MLPNKCNKKQAVNQGVMKIDDDDEVCEIIEEIYRRDKFDFGLISQCENNEDANENEEKVAAMSYDKVY